MIAQNMTEHAENELVNVKAQLMDAKNMIVNLTKMLNEAEEHAMHSTCTAVSVALYVLIAVVTVVVLVVLGTVLCCRWKHHNPVYHAVNRCVSLKQLHETIILLFFATDISQRISAILVLGKNRIITIQSDTSVC